jgi:hypothetical protein
MKINFYYQDVRYSFNSNEITIECVGDKMIISQRGDVEIQQDQNVKNTNGQFDIVIPLSSRLGQNLKTLFL